MITKKFIPTEELLKIDEKWRLDWADLLDNSKQVKHSMASMDDTSHCCLCVLERANGAQFENYKNMCLPKEMRNKKPTKTPCGKYPQNIVAAKMEPGSVEHNLIFAILNDQYLSHREIAEILRGNVIVKTYIKE